ncbi:hypothetical protein SYNPS1DRAFT_26337 [Syncephalis pseudoplumigaleata]|uniref:Uncharacterized protein n=1 Tax=Syncephalis pseudoplumigaleata TaxID=1712513 RepID=A0A4V1J2C5_9FUNG|nr:hypothetical protein SYNPS1DRAFT_26337 [Syncephalis pseudoplumigaleata]|eukprot:RKP28079.1 hypothetical protein SYNPS1DRAFT_26337 [Syncephalis pseudoplumigaleata]
MSTSSRASRGRGRGKQPASRSNDTLLTADEQESVFHDAMDQLVASGIYREKGGKHGDYYIDQSAKRDVLQVEASRMLRTFLYERSIEIALLARDMPELTVALARLIDELYPALARKETPRRSQFTALRLILLASGPAADASRWLQLYTRTSSVPTSRAVDHLWDQFAARISQAYRCTDWSAWRREQQAMLAALASYEGSAPVLASDAILIQCLWELPVDLLSEWLCFDGDLAALTAYLRTQAITLNDAGTVAYLRPIRHQASS